MPVQPAWPPSTRLAYLDYTYLSQHPQVLGHLRLGQSEALRGRSRRPLPARASTIWRRLGWQPR